MYETMVRLQTADTIFYEAQRQVGKQGTGRQDREREEAVGAGWRRGSEGGGGAVQASL